MSDAPRSAAVVVAPERKAPIQIGDKGIMLGTFDELWRFAVAVAASGLAPKGIDKPESIVVAIQMGLELGLTPMAALQNIAIINGRPSIYGDAQLAIVRSTGLLESFEETETNDELDSLFREMCLSGGTATQAVEARQMRIRISQLQSKLKRDADDFGSTVFLKRRGGNEAFGRFTVADAKKAGLWGKQGPWTQYPARMMKFRARSFLLRDHFGDALKGLLTAEEARDIEPITMKPVFASRVSALPEPVAFSGESELTTSPQTAEFMERKDPAKDLFPDKPAEPVADKTPQQQLAELVEGAGWSYDQFKKWASETGLVPEADSAPYFSDLKADTATKLLNAQTGLINGLGAMFGKKGAKKA